jgi:hypothetical protein
MEGGNYMNFVVFVLGILVGVFITYVMHLRKRPSGTFIMDLSDPTKDVCRLELDENLNSIYTKKKIVLRVRVYEDNSQN